ncbi:MAG: NTP transferase domain-containing protein [Novosphingobium sp.]|jgi:choline kinase
MDALIIAAGFGSRLRDISESKPLTPVAGKVLIELGVRQAKAAGAQKVVVVTGHEADRVEAYLATLAEQAGIAIEAARVEDWSKPNGYSVMTGAARIDGDFLLMMADHIFAAPVLQRLAKAGGADRGVTLGIDRRTDSPLVDPDDATWVKIDDRGFIQAIGKTITEYDAVDCGAFLATQELPRAIGAAIAEGKSGSLSDGMQWLADRGRAATWDIGSDARDSWWLDVDDPRAHALAEAEAPVMLAEIYA